MDNREEKEIHNALSEQLDDMVFEEIPDTVNSPINEPVASGEVSVSSSSITVNSEEEEKEEVEPDLQVLNDAPEYTEESFEQIQNVEEPSLPPSDAPEQVIDEEEESEEESYGAGRDLELPNSHAALAADTFLGIANNGLELGGNFFIKIKKSKEVMQFKKARKFIDNQNKKNIERLKLDAEDKALLKPILIEVLKKRVKELTPEQQLIAASISILTKKVQLAVEMKAEGKILAENIRKAVREELARAKEDKQEEPSEVSEVGDSEIRKAA